MTNKIHEQNPENSRMENGIYNTAEIAAMADEELAVLALEDQGYFLYLIKRYEQKLLRYILRITNTGMEEAEDTLQEVFIKVYTNLNDFDPDLKFSSWIYRITHNRVISNFRKIQARPQATSLELNEDIVNRITADINPASEVDRKILREDLKRVISVLDHKYREILILKFFEEKDYKEISDILKKPMGTVATLLNRAKKKLFEEINKNDINSFT